AVFYADFIEDNDIWKTGNFLKFIQEGNDLGEKMENAFIKAFSLGYKKICIIGSDCYELTQVHLLKAFENLDKKPIVLGPSYDGGYYLLGMNRMVNELFYNKKWSSPSVFQDTINNLNQLSLEYSLIEKLNDVDEEKDLTDDLSN
ncbi:MAG: TIGR04282 family arsenosugar biosynthesis glycosyltransferase, partial [Bacteroidota bacterium]|nr:TIGR04282 family arsenosugar biosynthesis glycosyltransferase [Bacteroidota bacterium]